MVVMEKHQNDPRWRGKKNTKKKNRKTESAPHSRPNHVISLKHSKGPEQPTWDLQQADAHRHLDLLPVHSHLKKG